MKTQLLKVAISFTVLTIVPLACLYAQEMSIIRILTLDSLGAAQGVSAIADDLYVYGDREIGMMRKYSTDDTLSYAGLEYQFTIDGKDLINHPTGIAWNGKNTTFIGNSIRLNKEGTKWKAVIHAIDWDGLMKTKTLDGNLLATIDDDACVQGTRPEYVTYQGKSVVATSDYGPKGNEVRLYDPEALITAKKTSEDGVLVGKFTCSAWVQNLHWIAEKGILVLIQNQIEGRKWRLTYLDLEASMKAGKEVVLKQIDFDPADELEGFTLFGDKNQGLAVSSSRKNNAAITQITW
ncbi:hypothetical protein [Algoriphagus antarcticus]|uniref:Uncharacterized protein n=1 Tax=Algoriphagus antarcticus TaxID=238540 RepID=A0A3E0D6P6_9BACT|nr:hypothetical protein [Algoriphagus antarcticus]REG78380.1 hypothetical protein C8N25_13522 [Algoriphagus antarcticus]